VLNNTILFVAKANKNVAFLGTTWAEHAIPAFAGMTAFRYLTTTKFWFDVFMFIIVQ